MKSLFKLFMISSILLLSVFPQVFAFQEGKISETFENVREIRIKTVSGDCIVEKGKANVVKVELTYTYDDYDYEPELEQRGDRLDQIERFRGRSNRGRSAWRLTVPDNTNLDFSTASGDFEAAELSCTLDAETASGSLSLRNMNGEFRGSTASGDIEGRNLDGDIRFSTASGDVELVKFSGSMEISTASGHINAEEIVGEIEFGTASGRIVVTNASGEFDVGTASGDIDARGVEVKDRSEFSAASGDVEVMLAKSPEFDLRLSSASGDAVLNFDKNPIKGFIKMTAKTRRGDIRAPFEFDDEETYYKGDDEYVTKTATKGSDRPKIEISTSSGRAELLED